jgi:hypothetical protein
MSRHRGANRFQRKILPNFIARFLSFSQLRSPLGLVQESFSKKKSGSFDPPSKLP